MLPQVGLDADGVSSHLAALPLSHEADEGTCNGYDEFLAALALLFRVIVIEWEPEEAVFFKSIQLDDDDDDDDSVGPISHPAQIVNLKFIATF